MYIIDVYNAVLGRHLPAFTACGLMTQQVHSVYVAGLGRHAPALGKKNSSSSFALSWLSEP